MASKATGYQTKQGRRYKTHYRDEHGVKRTRGGFLRAGDANRWGGLLERARSLGLARAFLDLGDDWGHLLDVDSNEELRSRLEHKATDTLHAFMLDYFRLDAPQLAASTFTNYLGVYNRHIRAREGNTPLHEFEQSAPVTRLLGALTAAGVGRPTRDLAKAVLSAALSWGVENGRLSANGAQLMRRGSRRRSARVSQRAVSRESWEARSAARRAWALEPGAFWALHAGALARTGCTRVQLHRLGVLLTLEYGLGLRPQEALGATFRQLSKRKFRVTQVLTQAVTESGKKELRVIGAAKTAGAVRSTDCAEWVAREVAAWKAMLGDLGLPNGPDDFIIPGEHADGHYSWAQYQNLSRDLRSAARAATKSDAEEAYLERATHYSLRRGHISLRVLAGEDVKRIADDCGTSTQMIHRHYLHELDLRDDMPDGFTFESAVSLARKASGGPGLRAVS